MIPAILHQTAASASLPDRIQRFRASWRKHNPGFESRFYDNVRCLKFVEQHFPRYLDTYLSFPLDIHRADFFRYLVVYYFGGFYADVDMECVRCMDRFLALNGAILTIEAHLTPGRQRELGYRRPFQIANFVFAAEPRHPFLLEMVERIVEASSEPVSSAVSDVEDATGPRLLTRVFYNRPQAGVRVLEQIYWAAPDLYANLPCISANIYARHHYCGSWKTEADVVPIYRRIVERNRLPPPFPASPFRLFET